MMRRTPFALLLLSLWTPLPRGAESFSLPSPLLPRTSKHDVAGFVGNDIGADLRRQNVPDACIVNDDGILAALFGSNETRDDFFEHSFGRRAAHFPRSKRQIEPPLTGIDLRSLYETNEWMSLRKRGSQNMLDKSKTSYDQMTDYVAEGGSVVIPVTPDDYLQSTKLRVERALGVREGTGTTVNVYHSGPSAVALNLHYDSWPVLVLQLAGEKEWTVQDDAFGRPLGEITRWENVTLAEGDLLYVPKGVYHAATTSRGCDVSTHATIGLTP